MPLYFLPYQTRWILDDSPLKIIEKSRQIGISFADAYDSVMKAGIHGGLDVWVSSRDEAQARLYLEDCKKLACTLQLRARELGQPFFDRDSESPAYVLEFPSHRRIYSLSSNPNALAGKRGHVKLDEFALHQDQQLLYRVAKPVTTWGGQLSIISTHRGHGSVFNQIIRDIKERGNPMGWSLHSVPIQRALEEGLVEKINYKRDGALGRKFGFEIADPEAPHPELRKAWLDRVRAECLDEAHWLQEYCCTPADDSSAFITFDLLTSCEDANAKLMSIDELEAYVHSSSSSSSSSSSGLQLFLGMDVARKHDLCVIDVGEKIGDVVWDRLRIELLGRSFSEIEAELFRLLRLRQLKRACLDATGLGLQLAERAERKFGWKVEPVTFTAATKEELAFGLRADFQDRKLRLPPDEKLRADLRAVKKEVTSSGNIRFAGESGDGHCDRFWAKALRQHAARTVPRVSVVVG
jgi:phage FluMu gp28-like protein